MQGYIQTAGKCVVCFQRPHKTRIKLDYNQYFTLYRLATNGYK